MTTFRCAPCSSLPTDTFRGTCADCTIKNPTYDYIVTFADTGTEIGRWRGYWNPTELQTDLCGAANLAASYAMYQAGYLPDELTRKQAAANLRAGLPVSFVPVEVGARHVAITSVRVA